MAPLVFFFFLIKKKTLILLAIFIKKKKKNYALNFTHWPPSSFTTNLQVLYILNTHAKLISCQLDVIYYLIYKLIFYA